MPAGYRAGVPPALPGGFDEVLGEARQDLVAGLGHDDLVFDAEGFS
jgi:hypothetical protein